MQSHQDPRGFHMEPEGPCRADAGLSKRSRVGGAPQADFKVMVIGTGWHWCKTDAGQRAELEPGSGSVLGATGHKAASDTEETRRPRAADTETRSK